MIECLLARKMENQGHGETNEMLSLREWLDETLHRSAFIRRKDKLHISHHRILHYILREAGRLYKISKYVGLNYSWNIDERYGFNAVLNHN